MKKKNIILLCVALIAAVAVTGFATPGSQDDPVVSLSYLTEHVIPEIKAYVDEALGKSNAASAGFEVVTVPAGTRVIASASTELILRQGKATVIATQKGGLADVTAGYDLANNSNAPSNHLLIVPVDDGRGLAMQTDGIVMIKGTYKTE